MSEHTPLSHYDYPILDVECCCAICNEWRTKRLDYDNAKRMIRNHSRSCYCWKCCKSRELQIEYLAAQGKRDLYCEMSWHAKDIPHGKTLMAWLQKELTDSQETPGWWAKTSPCFSLGHWVYKFKMHVTSLAASGSYA